MGFFRDIITDARRRMGTTAPVAGIVDATQPDWPASPTATALAETTETAATVWEVGNLDAREPQAPDQQSKVFDQEHGRSRLQTGHVHTTHPDQPASPTTTAPTETTETAATVWEVGTVSAVGKPDTEITLVREHWDHNHGWTTQGTPLKLKLRTPILDPADLTQATASELVLPISAPGQALLYAYRHWQRPDGATVTLRSNPLLVTVYQETPA